MSDYIFLFLFHLPLSEPTLVERQTDIDAERVLCNESLRVLTNPLCRDIKKRAVVISVHDRNAETCAYSILFRTILS